MPSISAPIERAAARGPGRAARRRRCRSVVVPCVRAAAINAFSVAITDGSSMNTVVLRRPSGASSTISRSHRDPGAHRAECVEVRIQAAAADYVAARRRQLGAAKARKQRAREQERGTDLLGERRVDLGLRDLRGAQFDFVGPNARRRRPRARRGFPASPRRRESAARFRSARPRLVSRQAARIGSAPFLFPAAVIVPDNGTPPSITNFSMSFLRPRRRTVAATSIWRSGSVTAMLCAPLSANGGLRPAAESHDGTVPERCAAIPLATQNATIPLNQAISAPQARGASGARHSVRRHS